MGVKVLSKGRCCGKVFGGSVLYKGMPSFRDGGVRKEVGGCCANFRMVLGSRGLSLALPFDDRFTLL